MLKWIFSLGVEHERNRVKRLLSELGRDLSTQTQYWQEDSAKASEKRQKQIAVNEKALQIIGSLLYPRYEDQTVVEGEPLIDRAK